MATTPSTSRSLSVDSVERFRRGQGGVAIVPSDVGYDASRSVWNGMINHRPAVIIEPVSTADVVVAIGFAREQGLPVAIRGGGHNTVGRAVCDDGLVIDLRRMCAVEVDPERRVARARAARRGPCSMRPPKPMASRRPAAPSR